MLALGYGEYGMLVQAAGFIRIDNRSILSRSRRRLGLFREHIVAVLPNTDVLTCPRFPAGLHIVTGISM